ncbi:heavy metal-binding domain-containing protein [Streptomyces sp. NPDC047061]|uniref:heavy metal-binding domain-containing protein n=1 Tax=Streptomyces sp. NPDC047061 TaxID=3154605 RepID=UPI0034042555
MAQNAPGPGRQIQLYTTDTLPLAGYRIVRAWFVWMRRNEMEEALNALARNAVIEGADAVIGVRLAVSPASGFSDAYVLYGTAVKIERS